MKNAHRQLIFQLSQAVAIAAAAFLLLATGLLISNQFRGKVGGLTKSTEMSRLQAELKKIPKTDPRNQQMKSHIRQVDLEMREDLFMQLGLTYTTGRAMLWALIVFLASAHFARVFRAKPPNPLEWGPRQTSEEPRTNRFARYAVAGVFGLVAAAGVGVAMHPVQLPVRETAAQPPPPEPPVTAAELAANWFVFRGPNGMNHFADATMPVGWDPKAGNGVLWKTEVPLPGLSSPIRWGDALFLTGASGDENRVFRFDAETGALVWSATLKVPSAPKPSAAKVNDGTGLAAPSMATDGRRVYATFANGDVAAFTLDGKQVWAKNVGLPENSYGFAASLAWHGDRIFIQLDLEEGKSKLLALKSATGEQAWTVKREVSGSWSSPVVADVDGQPQLILAGNPLVVAYNPTDGTELWKASLLKGDVAPSPLFVGGSAIVVAPGSETFALKPGSGEVAWKLADGAPETSSPASDGQRLYLVSSGGALTCVDVATGKVKWTEETGEEGYASPIIAGNTVLMVQRGGTMLVCENADTFKQLHKADLGESCDTTPLLHNNRLYIRGSKHLFCLQAPAAVAKQ